MTLSPSSLSPISRIASTGRRSAASARRRKATPAAIACATALCGIAFAAITATAATFEPTTKFAESASPTPAIDARRPRTRPPAAAAFGGPELDSTAGDTPFLGPDVRGGNLLATRAFDTFPPDVASPEPARSPPARLPLESDTRDTPLHQARLAVRDAVQSQLDRLSEGIAAHESSRPRGRLLQRRMTVETFIVAGLAPQQLLFGHAPDIAAPWRFAFDGVPRQLEPASHSAGDWRPLGNGGRHTPPAGGLAGRFRVSFARSVGGDDPVTIAGRFLVRPERAMLAATWCEPCLAPDAVDFPILPEGFLLEWDDAWRTIRVRLPRVDHHAERTLVREDIPPRLDQPDDLYDLFDGLRTLPWLLDERGAPASLSRSPHETSRRAEAAVQPTGSGGSPLRGPDPTTADTPATRVPNADAGIALPGIAPLGVRPLGVRPLGVWPLGMSPPSPAEHGIWQDNWIARTSDGRVLQRVTLARSNASGATLILDQSPIETIWTSSDRYELVGDVLGEPMPTRVVRPEGTIVAHEGGTRMTLSITLPDAGAAATHSSRSTTRTRTDGTGGTGGTPHTNEIGIADGADPPTSMATADARIESGGRLLATIRWDRLRLLSRIDADREEASLRHAFDPPARSDSERDGIDPFVALDAGAAARRDLRDELRIAIEGGTPAQVRDRLAAHLARLALDDLPATTAVRSIEALEERLRGRHLDEATAARLALAWRQAIRRCSRAGLHALLDDRTRQGRFGAAWRLARTLAGETPLADALRTAFASNAVAVQDGDANGTRSAAASRVEVGTESDSVPTDDSNAPITHADVDPSVPNAASHSTLATARIAAAHDHDRTSSGSGLVDFQGIAERLSTLLARHDRASPSWYEPPGRRRLETALADTGPRETATRQSGAGVSPRRRTAAPPPLEDLVAGLLDEAIADCGTWPRRGSRERLLALLENTFASRAADERMPSWSDPADRRRLAVAMRLFIGERRHLLAAHLRTPVPSDGDGSATPTEFERTFKACLARLLRLGPTDPAAIHAGEREESLLLASILRLGDRLAKTHRWSADAAASLRAELVAISDARRLRRASVCFPAFLKPLADPETWQDPSTALAETIDHAVASDHMLAAIAERIAIEDRLIAADSSTATFRKAMRSAQIDALATRLDGVVLDAIRGVGGGGGGVDATGDTSMESSNATSQDLEARQTRTETESESGPVLAREGETSAEPEVEAEPDPEVEPDVESTTRSHRNPSEELFGHAWQSPPPPSHPQRVDDRRFRQTVRWILEGGSAPP